MNDFLHNIRRGNTKRYDRQRKNDDRPGYPGQDRQYNRERKNYPPRKGPDAELLGAVRKLLEALVENQRRTADLIRRVIGLAAVLIGGRLQGQVVEAVGRGRRGQG